MCGIFGIWQRDKNPIDLQSLKAATTTLRHRGPDDEGYLLVNTAQARVIPCGGPHTDEQLRLPVLETMQGGQFDFAFGFRRLAILDLSGAGHQPMSSPDGRYWIVFNGEIYNYLELRTELKGYGYTFRSQTDTEVILAAFQHWGPPCLQRFNGMWALAIWDTVTQSLFLARDRFGIKPLHYAVQDGCLRFASEIKALVGPHGMPFAPNERMIYRYLLAELLPNPLEQATFFEHIFSLPAGHQATVTATQIQIERYWQLETTTTSQERSAEATVAAYQELFTDAVKLRLRADVPVGTCLSGGLDSSAITATIHHLLSASEIASSSNFPQGRQQTFSAVYDSEGRYNERHHIERVLNHLPGVVGHFTFPTAERLLADLRQFVWHQDEPVLSPSPFAQWCVMQKAREQGVTVLLDGQGADEALAGYRPFGIYLQQWLSPGQLAQLWREMGDIGQVTGLSTRRLLQQLILARIPDNLLMQLRLFWWRLKSSTELFLPDFAMRWWDTLPEGYPHQRADTLNQHLGFKILVALPELLRYEDRNSMAHSIEARVPFLDYRLMEFTFQAADALRVHQGWTKWILRKAMEDKLPKEIIWRKDKIGFETPQHDWLPKLVKANPALFADDALSRKFLNLALIRQRLPQLLNEQRPNRSLLWRLINLEIWLQAWQQPAQHAQSVLTS